MDRTSTSCAPAVVTVLLWFLRFGVLEQRAVRSTRWHTAFDTPPHPGGRTAALPASPSEGIKTSAHCQACAYWRACRLALLNAALLRYRCWHTRVGDVPVADDWFRGERWRSVDAVARRICSRFTGSFTATTHNMPPQHRHYVYDTSAKHCYLLVSDSTRFNATRTFAANAPLRAAAALSLGHTVACTQPIAGYVDVDHDAGGR